MRAQLAANPHLQMARGYVERLLQPGSPERARLDALRAGESAKVDLGGGMFAIDAAYLSKRRAEVFFETHRKYIDVQAVIEGEESMEIVDRSRLAIDVPYDAEKDLVKYHDVRGASILHAHPGEVEVFFPEDGHMSHAVGEPVLVRKTVVKVPV